MCCMRVTTWVSSGLLVLLFGGCNSSPEATSRSGPLLADVSFWGEIRSFQLLTQYSGSLVATERDPAFVVTFTVLSDSSPRRFLSGQQISIAVHSVANVFASSEKDLIGRKFEMKLAVISAREHPVYQLTVISGLPQTSPEWETVPPLDFD